MQWSPRSGETIAFAGIGLALAGATVLVDPVGRVLVGAAALLVLAVAARDVLLRPRVRTSPAGVTVRTGGGAVQIPWPRLAVRVRTSRRWGVQARTLELEDRADDAVLLVLGRRDLGADPAEVADRLRAATSSPGQPTT